MFFLALYLLLTPPAFVFAQWPFFHADLARTGFSDSMAPSEPKIFWQITARDLKNDGIEEFAGGQITPVIKNGVVFVAGAYILALDLNTGKLLWKYKDINTDFYPSGALAIDDERVFIAVNNTENLKTMNQGYIYSIEAKTGKFLWKSKLQSSISHSFPLVYENKVFIGDDSGRVYAINSKNGEIIWQKYLESAEVIHSSPAFSGGLIYIGTEGSSRSNRNPSYLYALNVQTGEVVWRYKIDFLEGKLNLIHGTPAVLNGKVYFGSENGYFYALSTQDGKLIWKKQIGFDKNNIVGVTAAPALGYEKVFVNTWSGKIFALSQDAGETIWEFSFSQSETNSAPVLADNKVYFGANDYFYCLDAKSGKLLWKEKWGGFSAALADGILIIVNPLAMESFSQSGVILAIAEKAKTDKPNSEVETATSRELKWQSYLIIVLATIIISVIIYLYLKGRKNKK